MPLIRTFDELADDHQELRKLLEDLEIVWEEEALICDAIVAMTSNNPQHPLRGQKLWDKINDLYPYAAGVPNFFNLMHEISYKCRELVSLAADIASKPTIQAFLAEQALTDAIVASRKATPLVA